MKGMLLQPHIVTTQDAVSATHQAKLSMVVNTVLPYSVLFPGSQMLKTDKLPGTCTQSHMQWTPAVIWEYFESKNFHVKIFVLENFCKGGPITKIFNNEKFSRARITVDLASHAYGTGN